MIQAQTSIKALIDTLEQKRDLSDEEFLRLLADTGEANSTYLFERAHAVRQKEYGSAVFLRALIEITNYCTNNCLYCGIRAGNGFVHRYRLSEADILEQCKTGYALGMRTFVLQGGEDPYFTDDILCRIVRTIRVSFPDCAITLSLGERSFESYKKLYDAGADRYLLRHETASDVHYKKLHPHTMSLQRRLDCLYNLKQIGFQVGAGMMIGSPFQTMDYLMSDFRFLQKLNPHMVGLGPFIPSEHTPFKEHKSGDLSLVLKVLSIVRLLLPKTLLPATTALGTLDDTLQFKALLCGCNVLMPNVTPTNVKNDYQLYDNKKDVSADMRSIQTLEKDIENIGLIVVRSRGDSLLSASDEGSVC